MIDETQNLRVRVRSRGASQPIQISDAERARFEASLNRDDEITDATRASRLARSMVGQFDVEMRLAVAGGEPQRKWHDVDLTLARHVLRLEARLADLSKRGST